MPPDHGDRIGRAGRRVANVDADTDDHRRVRVFEEDAGDLGTADQHVVRPFQFGLDAVGQKPIHRVGDGECGDEAEFGGFGRGCDGAQQQGDGLQVAGRAVAECRAWRPRPAVCWRAHTAVPCGAPW